MWLTALSLVAIKTNVNFDYCADIGLDEHMIRVEGPRERYPAVVTEDHGWILLIEGRFSGISQLKANAI
jgi:hypothetical protein